VRSVDLPKTGLDLAPWPTHILGYLRTFFAANNIALPELQRIVPGMLALDAWDCEQLAVGCAGIGEAGGQQGTTTGAPRAGSPYSAMSTRQVSYGIQLVRCIGACGTSFPPDSEVINAAGMQQLADMGILSQAVANLASSPPDWHPKEVNIIAGDVAPLGPTGGYWAVETNVTFSTMALKTLEV
jgi:hypothetical protein